MKTSLLFIIISLITFASCKKYDEGPGLSLSSKKSRVLNQWKVDKVSSLNGNDISYDYPVTTKRNLEFKNDDTYIISWEGAGSETGSWNFDTDKKNLVLTSMGSTYPQEMEIIQLKSKSMQLKEDISGDMVIVHYSSK